MKYHKKAFAVLAIMLTIFISYIPSLSAKASPTYAVTYVRLDGTIISTTSISDGDSYGTFPAEADVAYWLDETANIVQTTDSPSNNKTITAIHNSDISSSGTLDSGNVIWFIAANRLYITGNGTLSIANRKVDNASWTYTVQLGTERCEYPSIMHSWINSPEVEDELGAGYGTFNIPDENTYELEPNTEYTVSFTKDTVSFPASALTSAEPWLAQAGDLKEVYLSESLKLSGNFSYFFNPTSTPTNIVSSVYNSLKNVYVFANTTSVTRMSGMFALCPSLENVYIQSDSDFDCSSCLDTSNMFYGDEKLQNASGTSSSGEKVSSIINKFSNTGNVVDTRFMFFSCKELNKPALSSFDFSSVKDSSYMFTGCNNLQLTCGNTFEPSDIGSWNTANLKYAIAMFTGANVDLTANNPTMDFTANTSAKVVGNNFDLSKWDLSNLISSIFMLANNHDLATLKWSGDVNSLENASCMLSGCTSLQTVDFENLSTASLSAAVAMFSYSGTESAEANFDSWDISSLKDARIMFHESGFCKISLNETNPVLLENAMGMFWNCKNLISLGTNALSDWTLPNLKDASYMFYGNSSITSINVTTWGMETVEDLSYMVGECTSLTNFNPIWNVSSKLENIQCFMYNCSKITSLYLSNWDVSGVRNAFSAFSKMSALTSIVLDGWSFDNIEICNGMFAYDYSLLSVDLNDCIAPKLTDAGGMFFNCTSLTSANISSLISAATKNISYCFANCTALETLDISGSNTSGVQYMQAFVCNDEKLSSLKTGNGFSTESAISMAQLLKNCHNLANSDIQTILRRMDASVAEDLYEMCYNCSNLNSIDLSATSFPKANLLTRMFGADNALTVIKLPADFGSAVISLDKASNIFACSDETMTFLTITSDDIPDFIKNYDWNSDNRKFLMKDSSTINGMATTSFQLSGDTNSTAEMLFNVTSTFYLNETAAPLAYEWKNGTQTLSETGASYTASVDATGSYSCTAYIAGLLHSAELTETFTLTKTSGVTDISAKYTGNPIAIGKNYNLNDVSVTVIMNSGTGVTLKPSEFTVSDTLVTKNGKNQFTAYYTDSQNVTYSTQFTVPGKRIISEIEVTYSGPDVLVGTEYSQSYISMIAYYEDDTTHAEGFRVIPSSFNASTISKVGDNIFTAFYEDSSNNNNILSANFTVKGYSEANIASISAKYDGPDVAVGSDFNKQNVIVTVHHNDGTADSTTDNFSLSSTLVSALGENVFEVTVSDSDGSNYNASFSVTGVDVQTANISYIEAVYDGPEITVGCDYDKANVVVTLHYSDGTNDATTTNFTVNKTLVASVGSNSFEAYVQDSAGNSHTGAFFVTGLAAEIVNISSVEASYNGPSVPVGKDYDKNNVKVTVFYADGTTATVTDFTVSSTAVASVGSNQYTATVYDSGNTPYSSTFYVDGIEVMETKVTTSSNSSDASSGNTVSSSNKGAQTGDSMTIYGWFISLCGLIVLLCAAVYQRFSLSKGNSAKH